MAIPKDLVMLLRERFHIEDFVETGTYLGDTAAWAASHFPRVTTIELSEPIYRTTLPRFASVPAVKAVFGDSRKVLRDLLPSITDPAVLWLDGHWSQGLTYGRDDECPLLAELAAANASSQAHFILIDDARLFLAPPPKPHRIDQWPSLRLVLETLTSGGKDPYIVVMDDVIVSVPPRAKDVVAAYCQERATRLLEEETRVQAARANPRWPLLSRLFGRLA
jgi:hypothetical protein